MLEKSHDNDEMQTDDGGCKLIKRSKHWTENACRSHWSVQCDLSAKKSHLPSQTTERGSVKWPSRMLSFNVCGWTIFLIMRLYGPVQLDVGDVL